MRLVLMIVISGLSALPAPQESAPRVQVPDRGVRRPVSLRDGIALVERRIFERVNLERQRQGLPAFIKAEDLTSLARAHSADMLARNYFAHKTPEGLAPWDRIRSAGLSKYTGSGENIVNRSSRPALELSVSLADKLVDDWMHSSGHRANILATEFEYVGVGAAANGTSIMATLLFGSTRN